MNTDDKSQGPDSAIPLLEDVVSMVEIESEYIDFDNQETDQEDSGTPALDEELLSMRDDIARQLEDELQAIVAEAVSIAIDDATSRVSRILHDELDVTLTRRVSNLIEQRLEKAFGVRHQQTDDEPNLDSLDLYRDDNL